MLITEICPSRLTPRPWNVGGATSEDEHCVSHKLTSWGMKKEHYLHFLQESVCLLVGKKDETEVPIRYLIM